jgi:thioredoxin-related protein
VTPRISLERSANIATIVMCVAVAAVAVSRQFPRTPQYQATESLYKPGEKIPESIKPASALVARTVFAAVRRDCRYCQESMGFYKELTKVAGEVNAKIVFVTLDSADVARQSLVESGVQGGEVVLLPKGTKINGTPTLIVTDQQGTVIRSWVGKLAPNQEKELVALLRQRVS